jgi:hypothetical protein
MEPARLIGVPAWVSSGRWGSKRAYVEQCPVVVPDRAGMNALLLRGPDPRTECLDQVAGAEQARDSAHRVWRQRFHLRAGKEGWRRRGVRASGAIARPPIFKTGAMDRSATSLTSCSSCRPSGFLWLHVGCTDGRRTPVRRPNDMT